MSKSMPFPEIVTSIYTLLEPLNPEERVRAARSALTMLGEPVSGDKLADSDVEGEQDDFTDSKPEGLGKAATRWVTKHKFTKDELECLFHFDNGKVEYIGNVVWGSNKKDQTMACYLIAGICNLLGTDEPSFDDEAARELCQQINCFSRGNHATYIRDMGGSVRGSKTDGFKLTMPAMCECGENLRLVLEKTNA